MADSMRLHQKVAIISGGTRGTGAATALALAKNGCHVIITGKTDKPHATLKGTIHSVAEECRHYGVEAMPIQCDIRNESEINDLVIKAIKMFGKIDILINAASMTYLINTLDIDTQKFDLMNQINVRGTYLLSQACIPFLKLSDNGHIVNFAPPLVLSANYFNNHLGYTLSKYGMSMCSLGMAHEFYHDNIAVNSLWSRTAIKNASTENKVADKFLRKPTIMADAVVEIVTKPSKVCTGCFLIDDLVLMGAGVTDFDQYAYEAGHPLIANLFLPHDIPRPPVGVTLQK